MSKSTTFTWQITEAKAQHRDLIAEALTYHERLDTNYNTLVDVQTITTKVVDEGIAMLQQETPNVEVPNSLHKLVAQGRVTHSVGFLLASKSLRNRGKHRDIDGGEINYSFEVSIDHT
jgi:hypothetical protein